MRGGMCAGALDGGGWLLLQCASGVMFVDSIGILGCCMTMFGMEHDLLWARWTAGVISVVGEDIMVFSGVLWVL